jgi:AcrR family transcriptional regulator
MPRTPTVSPDRILQVAAREFADRGFAGARVDRIARLARVNKAMLYYHFKSKTALYRRCFAGVLARRPNASRPSPTDPGRPTGRFTMSSARWVHSSPSMRSFRHHAARGGDGGVHLDARRSPLAALPLTVGAIVRQGVAERTLRPLNPVAAYFMMFAPIVMFMTGAPLRGQLTSRQLVDMSKIPPDRFVEQLQESIRLAFIAR